jgi:hypothetical protein
VLDDPAYPLHGTDEGMGIHRADHADEDQDGDERDGEKNGELHDLGEFLENLQQKGVGAQDGNKKDDKPVLRTRCVQMALAPAYYLSFSGCLHNVSAPYQNFTRNISVGSYRYQYNHDLIILVTGLPVKVIFARAPACVKYPLKIARPYGKVSACRSTTLINGLSTIFGYLSRTGATSPASTVSPAPG